MHQLPLPPESFDAVTFRLVLHYAEDPAGAITEAARVLRPGGRLVVIDFATHAEESLREEHAHRWLGFADDQLAGWYRAAGLVPAESVRLPGDPLPVCPLPAARAANAAVAHGRRPPRAGSADRPPETGRAPG